MSGLLGSLVSQVAQSAMSGGESNGLSDMLGDAVGNAVGGGAMGDMLGNAIGGAIGGDGENTASSSVAALLGGALGGGEQNMLLAGVMPMVLSWVQEHDGLAGALEFAKNLGFEEQIQSWLSPQDNINLQPEQVTDLFGVDKIAEVAAKFGGDENAVTAGIAQMLPEVINKLTPEGGLEHETAANQEIGDVLGQLSKFF